MSEPTPPARRIRKALAALVLAGAVSGPAVVAAAGPAHAASCPPGSECRIALNHNEIAALDDAEA